MARLCKISKACYALLLGVLLAIPTSVLSYIGVCYGNLGDNLPPPNEVIGLYKSLNIQAMRIYGPNQDVFQALKGSNIQLILDVPNEQLQSFATNFNAANAWVQSNIKPYAADIAFRYIAVGNEVIPGSLAQYVLPAMNNIQGSLEAAGLNNQIKVSTSVSQGILGASYPPSAGAFSSDALSALAPIAKFLSNTGAPLLVNVYPYFAYIGDKSHVNLDYALFKAPGPIVFDGSLSYQNMFDALVDAVYSALEKVGAPNVRIVVSETGWPSDGGDAATLDNAGAYNSLLIKHVGQGTPKRPGGIETYIFAMFDEDEKPAGVEEFWGLYLPNKTPVYPLQF